MIQRITKNTDINFLLDNTKIAEKFIIRFFTTDRTKAIVRTSENVVTEADGKKYIKLPWSTLRLLNNGMLNYEVQNLAPDTDYNDGVFDSTFSVMSKYYIYSDVNDTDTAEVLNEKLDILTESKQDKLTAGKNVTIKDNTINAAENITITQDDVTIGVGAAPQEGSVIIRNGGGIANVTNGRYSVAIGEVYIPHDDSWEGEWPMPCGQNSVAVGYNASAGNNSVVVGSGAIVKLDMSGIEKGECGVAVGDSANTLEYGVAVGYSSSSGMNGTAIGTQANSEGECSVSVGNRAHGSEKNAIAIGSSAWANGDNSIAIGEKAKAAAGELVLRSNNKDMIKANANGKIYILDGATVMCIQDEIKALKTQLSTMKTQMDKIDTSSSSTGDSWSGAK